MSDELESLLAYCQEKRRVCPMPYRWNELFEMLRRYEDTPAHGTDDLFGYMELRMPMILGGWDASNRGKSERLAEHLAWADAHGALPEVATFINPARPMQNGHCESFNGKLRDECLSQN